MPGRLAFAETAYICSTVLIHKRMILASFSDTARYEVLHPLLQKAFAYLRSHDLREVPAGRISLDGDALYINVADATLLAPEAQKLEVHRAYLDIHVPLSGPEVIGWRHLADIDVPSEAPFDEAGDFALYTAPASTYFTVAPGQFAIVWPEDAHAPILGTGTLRKAIVKVRL